MMLELRHLEVLAALRDHGTLNAAAERLHLTPSALSHQLLALEERLGAGLFVRRTRPVQFTAAGNRLLELADATLPRVRAAERDIARLNGRRGGRLHIAIECHSCYQWLMPTLNRYRQEWPEVAVDLTASFSFDALPALERGEVDLVVTSDPQELRGIVYRPLFRHEAVITVARGHPLARRGRVEPKDLAEETLITYPVPRERLDVFTGFLEPAGVEPAAVRTAELTVMLLQLVASGRGVAMLPNWALTEAMDGDALVALPLSPERKFGTLYAAVQEETAEAAYVRDFLQTARETSFATLTGIEPVAQ